MCALATLARQDLTVPQAVHRVSKAPTRPILDPLSAPGVGKENSLRSLVLFQMSALATLARQDPTGLQRAHPVLLAPTRPGLGRFRAHSAQQASFLQWQVHLRMCALAMLEPQDWTGQKNVRGVFSAPTKQNLDLRRAPSVKQENRLQ